MPFGLPAPGRLLPCLNIKIQEINTTKVAEKDSIGVGSGKGRTAFITFIHSFRPGPQNNEASMKRNKRLNNYRLANIARIICAAAVIFHTVYEFWKY